MVNCQEYFFWQQRLRQSRMAYLRNLAQQQRVAKLVKLLESKGSTATGRGATIAQLAALYVAGADITQNPDYLRLVTEEGADIRTEIKEFILTVEEDNEKDNA